MAFLYGIQSKWWSCVRIVEASSMVYTSMANNDGVIAAGKVIIITITVIIIHESWKSCAQEPIKWSLLLFKRKNEISYRTQISRLFGRNSLCTHHLQSIAVERAHFVTQLFGRARLYETKLWSSSVSSDTLLGKKGAHFPQTQFEIAKNRIIMR